MFYIFRTDYKIQTLVMKLKRFNNIVILIFVFILLSGKVRASEKDKYFFRHIDYNEGLSQSSVICMLQDSKGYMWFGTSNGLNKYDGYSFTVFTHNPLDSNSLSDNGINTVIEDKNGIIWIGTVKGILNRYDRTKGIFTKIGIANLSDWYNIENEQLYDYPIILSRNSNSAIKSICEDDSGFLWIGTWGKGLVRLNPAKGEKKYYYKNEKNKTSLLSNRITAIIKDAFGNIWIGTFGGGLHKVIISENGKVSFIRFTHIAGNPYTISDNRITSLYFDSMNNLWVGTFHGGVCYAKVSGKDFAPQEIKFSTYNKKNGGIRDDRVIAITEDSEKNIWLGTFGGGLYRLNPVNRNNIFFNSEQNFLLSNEILSIYTDNSGLIWIGYHLGKGISIIEKGIKKFNILKKNGTGKGLNDEIVWSVYEDTDSCLWIGTYKGGLNKWDMKRNKFKYYMNRPEDKFSISDNHIRCIVEDKYNTLWIGTYSGGLNRFDKKSEKFYSYKNDYTDFFSLPVNQVQALYIQSDSILWVGTYGGGLSKTIITPDIKKHLSFKSYQHDPANQFSISGNKVYSITPENDTILWIGTHGQGLNKFNTKKEKFYPFKFKYNDPNSIRDNRILTTFVQNDSILLIGTYGGGLNVFNKNTEQFRRYLFSDGLTSDVVYGVLEDRSHNLWLSSDNGIFKLNIDANSFSHFDLHDGVQGKEFSGGAYFKSKSGEMFFGGVNGLNYFFPDSIEINSHIPPIVITEIEVLGQKINEEIDTLILKYHENFISFKFAAIDYTNPIDNLYEYKLEGFENDWQKVSSKYRKAVYKGLDPGEYVFRVRGSNNDGVWNKVGTSLYVKILAPFWMQWWFILLVILIIGGTITWIINQRIKNVIAIEKLKTKLAADLHDNIGAGLTEISILSELVNNEIKDKKLKIYEKVKHISELSRSLVDEMSDTVWVISPKRDSLHDLFVRLKDSYNELLIEKGIKLKINNLNKIKDIKLNIEFKQNLYLILKEAINNSIKHSNCSQIDLDIDYDDHFISVKLKDNGKGFYPDDIKRGNGLDNMQLRAKAIGGELEIISDRGTGTLIVFRGKVKLSIFR